MLLHHLATNCLYFSYVFSGFLPFGATIAYLHDLADIPANVGKVLSSTTFELAALIDGLILMTIWAYTRCYLLPKSIYFLFTEPKMKDPDMAQFDIFIILSGVFLSVMCALHYFWFFLFIRMNMLYVKSELLSTQS